MVHLMLFHLRFDKQGVSDKTFHQGIAGKAEIDLIQLQILCAGQNQRSGDALMPMLWADPEKIDFSGGAHGQCPHHGFPCLNA
ncbi:hypothetical protein SDC9_174707 [bioreactor metagenome]|uniref:Uncharacterized protein n=1 Tax=bioreactor metagenome TaxID=1076179 RepID=A0A645GK53_9ZZZZ